VVVSTGQGSIRFAPTEAFGRIAGEDLAALTVGPLQAQSTNTSVTLSERLFLKCYRRLRPGVNPELEVGRFLTEVAEFRNCVPVAGAVEYLSENKEPVTLALLQAYVPNQGDGWTIRSEYLRRWLETQRGTPDASHAAYPSSSRPRDQDAELHRALATPSRNPAFTPEPLTNADVEAWKSRVREEAEQTLALVKNSELQERKARILALIDSCAAPRGRALKARHHGDYHLGQVLLANNDWYIIDFEGERRGRSPRAGGKHMPRDVAGMLRSFSYAKWSATKGNDLDEWERDARRTFLAAYAAATRGSGLFESFDDVAGLMKLFELEKVLYELRYELGNRPDWVQVPLSGLLAMLEEKR
jgi:maltose alpha-D-glucosyltransferase/alpha-amylase